MNTKNANEFVALFNKTEKWMKQAVGAREEEGYSSVLSRLKSKNSIVKRFSEELQLYGTLRNLMIHEKTNPDSYVAYPSDEIMQQFNHIYGELTKPELVLPKYQKSVQTIDLSDSLSSVLEIVKKEKYTNFPVYDNGIFQGLLTDNGITNWLSTQIKEDLVSILETKVHDVMPMEEERNNYSFISRHKSLYEARDIFENYTNQLDAILITEHGKENQKLMGIITSWDILNQEDKQVTV